MTIVATPWPERVLLLCEPAVEREWFTAEEWDFAASFRLQKRRDEWLWSRVAVKQLALRLGIATDARVCAMDRPWVTLGGEATRWQVSVSHSLPYAAAAIAREPIGVDVQTLRDVSPEIARLFLSPEEEAMLRGCGIGNALLHFWCAKEAAWKRSSPRFETLRQQPLTLVGEDADGLRFDSAVTHRLADAVIAISHHSADAAPLE